MTVHIVLVDDHEIVRIGLRTLLNNYPQFEVVGEAATAAEALLLAAQLKPDVVLMDIRLPGVSGIEACGEITRSLPQTRVVMLTSFAEDELLFDAIAAGATGYVLKQVGSQNLIQVIEAAARNEPSLDQSLVRQVFDRVRRSVELEQRHALSSLNDHEIRILSLLTRGTSNRDIGNALGLSEKTVRNYVSSILSKLELKSRAEAAAFAVKHHVDQVLQGAGGIH